MLLSLLLVPLFGILAIGTRNIFDTRNENLNKSLKNEK